MPLFGRGSEFGRAAPDGFAAELSVVGVLSITELGATRTGDDATIPVAVLGAAVAGALGPAIAVDAMARTASSERAHLTGPVL